MPEDMDVVLVDTSGSFCDENDEEMGGKRKGSKRGRRKKSRVIWSFWKKKIDKQNLTELMTVANKGM